VYISNILLTFIVFKKPFDNKRFEELLDTPLRQYRAEPPRHFGNLFLELFSRKESLKIKKIENYRKGIDSVPSKGHSQPEQQLVSGATLTNRHIFIHGDKLGPSHPPALSCISRYTTQASTHHRPLRHDSWPINWFVSLQQLIIITGKRTIKELPQNF
jgi:hypothetical protein